MKIRPQVLTGMIAIVVLAVPCYLIAPEFIEVIIVGAIIAEGNLATKVIDDKD